MDTSQSHPLIRRYILTGTSGAGKTSLIRFLEVIGYSVVEEAATDVIALEQAQGVQEPWTTPDFIDKIVTLQRHRQVSVESSAAKLQYFDRSPLDTYALSVFLDYPPSHALLEEVERMHREEVYQKKVFFVENLGFCQPSEARKISFADALRFEKVHEEVYSSWGYECVKIAPQTIPQRVDSILRLSL